jgi:hypothetical protein
VLGRDLPEATRNRLLRRADWRFLLPTPLPQRAISLARGPLAEAVGLMVPDQDGGSPGTAADLAVAVNPDSAILRSLFDRLAPGGTCYSEWHFRGAAGARRRLEKAGFEQVSTYWPWPWPGLSTAWFWVPLESQAAPAFLLATRLRARNPLRRAVDLPLRALWPRAHRAGWLRPVCAVARKPLGGAPRADGILDWLRDRWEGWELGPAPDHLSWLLLTRGPRTVSKPVGIVFAEPDPVPRLVVKRPRVPEAADGLQREAAALNAVQALRAGGMPGVPRVLSCTSHGGYPALVETALPGQPLFALLTHASYRDLALRATDWLIGLLAHRTPRPPRGAQPLVEQAMRDFQHSFGPVANAAGLGATERLLASLADLPCVVEQRDFSPWNVHVAADGQLVIFDWESAELNGMPMLDLIYFLSYLAFFYDGAIASGKVRQSYRRSLDPSSFTGRVHGECVERYAARLELDRSLVRPLRLLTWLIHSRSDYRHLTADAAGSPDPSALRESLFLALWEEELGT